jgi:hypothetical protein
MPRDFVLDHLPFWIVNYGLAVVIWTCLGRFLLAWFVPAIQPTNYIWRAFVVLTEWAVRATAWITPRYVRPVFLPPIAALWLFYARILAFILMSSWGWVPRLEDHLGG